MRLVTSAPNEFVADIICQRLKEGGVQVLPVGTSARPTSLAGGRDIYVEDDDLTRAHEILQEAEAAGDEMSEASGAAVQETQRKGIDPKTGKPYEPVEIPVPKRSLFDRLLHRAENRPSHGGDSGPYAAIDAVLDEGARELDGAFRERPPIDY
jgi:hypothetical protein